VDWRFGGWWFFLDQLNLWKFSVWAAAMARYSSYLMTFFFLGQHFCFGRNFFFFWGPLKKNLIKIWGANPPLGMTINGVVKTAYGVITTPCQILNPMFRFTSNGFWVLEKKSVKSIKKLFTQVDE
jgi:hypothetical protein